MQLTPAHPVRIVVDTGETTSIYNYGPGVVYYDDTLDVSSTLNIGVIAAGSSVSVSTSMYVIASIQGADVVWDEPALLAGRENAQPGLLAPTSRGWNWGQRAVQVNQAYLSRVVPTRQIVVSKIAFVVGTAASVDDAVDVGIYDQALARLVSTGSTAGQLNTTGVKVLTLPTPVTLDAGRVYYAAFAAALGGTAAVLVGAAYGTWPEAGLLFGNTAGVADSGTRGSALPLPATMPPPTWGSLGSLPALALRES